MVGSTWTTLSAGGVREWEKGESHAGEAGTSSQEEKMRFRAAVGERLAAWAAQGRWAVLYDEVFDPAKGEGQGPCALAVDPDGLSSVRVEPRSYPSYVILKAKPGVNQVRLAVWEFPDLPNADAPARFPAAADQATLKAAGVETTPAGLLAVFQKRTLSDAHRQPADQRRRRHADPLDVDGEPEVVDRLGDQADDAAAEQHAQPQPQQGADQRQQLSLIHISEPTRPS